MKTRDLCGFSQRRGRCTLSEIYGVATHRGAYKVASSIHPIRCNVVLLHVYGPWDVGVDRVHRMVL